MRERTFDALSSGSLIALIVAVAIVVNVVAVIKRAHGETGIASVYGNNDGHQHSRTASGERVNPQALTAAHKTLPFGTRVTVTNKRNGRTVIVRINDRGPFVRGRIIDVTPAGAAALGFAGLAPVTVETR